MSKINTPNQDTPSYFLASADIFERLAAVISMRMRVPGDVQGHAGQSVIIVPQACSQGNRPRFVIILQYATHMLPAATLAFSSSLYGGFTQTMMHHKWVFDCRWDASFSFHFLLRSSPPLLLYQPHYGSMSFRILWFLLGFSFPNRFIVGVNVSVASRGTLYLCLPFIITGLSVQTRCWRQCGDPGGQNMATIRKTAWKDSDIWQKQELL